MQLVLLHSPLVGPASWRWVAGALTAAGHDAVDGVLPRWSTWWSDGALEALVPDAERRGALEAELPEVPLAFYESPLDVPAGWCGTTGSYLLLSESYRADADRARALGWPTNERLGGHLDIVNEPDRIGHDVLELAAHS